MATDEASIGQFGLTPEQLFLLDVFHTYAFDRTNQALQSGTRFVHYTTADTAMRIFEHQEIWMRNALVMNDFMEIEHGFECLNAAYKKNKEFVKKTLGDLFLDIPEKLEQLFNQWLPHLRTETYIASVSEHGNQISGNDEDSIGRLSMWRAYGGTTGVAIVMNNGPFLRPSEALGAYTSPVAYLELIRK